MLPAGVLHWIDIPAHLAFKLSATSLGLLCWSPRGSLRSRRRRGGWVDAPTQRWQDFKLLICLSVPVSHSLCSALNARGPVVGHFSMAVSLRLDLKVLLHTVFSWFKKSFAEGLWTMCSPSECALSDLVWPAALDGNQVLYFYWTDPIDAMIRSVAKLQYKTNYTLLLSLECE